MPQPTSVALVALVALPVLGLACAGDDAATSASTGTSDATSTSGACDDPPTLMLENNTPWPMAALLFRACGTAEDGVFPFPPPGLEPGASFTVSLPAPGCYELQVEEPSGCHLAARISTGDLAACESLPVALVEDDFGCPGG